MGHYADLLQGRLGNRVVNDAQPLLIGLQLLENERPTYSLKGNLVGNGTLRACVWVQKELKQILS